MRGIVVLATAGALLAMLPYTSRGGALGGTILPVLVAIALAVAVSAGMGPLAVATGSLAAFFGSLAWPFAPWLGGGFVLTLAYAERTLRVRTLHARGIHVLLASLGGATAGALAANYSAAPLPLLAVATGMGAVASTLPFLVVADDARVLMLERAAARLPLLATSLRQAAELRRSFDRSSLDRETARQVETSWRALERVLEARLRVEASLPSEGARLVAAMLDRQITEHVASLLRVTVAATTMGAAEIGLDDSAMRDVHQRGEVLEEQSRAIVEVRGP